MQIVKFARFETEQFLSWAVQICSVFVLYKLIFHIDVHKYILLIMSEVLNQQWLEENGFTHEKLVELCDKRLQWLKELSDEMSDIDKLSRFILDDDIWRFLLASPHKLVIDVDMYNEFMNEVQNVPMIEIREALQKYKNNKK